MRVNGTMGTIHGNGQMAFMDGEGRGACRVKPFSFSAPKLYIVEAIILWKWRQWKWAGGNKENGDHGADRWDLGAQIKKKNSKLNDQIAPVPCKTYHKLGSAAFI